MPEQVNKTVTLGEIAAMANSSESDLDIVVYEGPISSAGIRNMSLRIDALMLLVCTSGRARLSIDLNDYEVETDTFVILHPHNYVAVYDSTDNLRGQMLVCSTKLVASILPKLSDLMPVILLSRSMPVLRLDREQTEWIQEIFRLVGSKLEKGRTRFLMPKLSSILQAILYEVMDISISEQPAATSISSRKEELMARFVFAVIQDCTRHRKVEYYANKLCISPKHLSAVVKELTGVTAGTIIDRHVTLEAKVLLKNTDLTIQEIAARLNFPNQSFFGKYFKHATGLSPTQYRASLPTPG